MTLRLRIPPLAVLAITSFLGWACARAFPAHSVLNLVSPIPLSATLLLFGAVCLFRGVASFRQARTTVNPTTPEAASALVVSGIYRVTRNPMYLGFLFLLLGELAWLDNAVALLVAPAFVLYLNRFQIEPEERALRERFGSEYSSYAARVRRWI